MTGGLLNIQSYGSENIILTGNPSKSFFKGSYSKYTNFGKQYFRLDYEGERYLHLNEVTKYKFKVKRYADLLSEMFLCVTLPNIWSPLCKFDNDEYKGYEFKWIKNIGTQMIKNIKFTIGGQTIQEFGGDYLQNMVERDFSESQKQQFYKMTGNIDELNDPIQAHLRGVYPHAVYQSQSDTEPSEIEPSIRSKDLYIPLNAWFSMNTKMAFPLVSLQYSELEIEIEIRPLKELFIIRDFDADPTGTDTYPSNSYIQPSSTNENHLMYRFLHPPPPPNSFSGDDLLWKNYRSQYTDKRITWKNDLHLLSKYIFLSEEEKIAFASKDQRYLFKEIHTNKFNKIANTNKVDIKTQGMISNFMFYLQRDDVSKRNEWSNYTNWEYEWIPYPFVKPTNTMYGDLNNNLIRVTGKYKEKNTKDILIDWSLVLDGKYRENTQKEGILKYIESYNHSLGDKCEGLYNYNFCLNTNPSDIQPSGAMNMNNFNSIEFELTSITPPLSDNPNFYNICNEDGTVGFRKEGTSIYDYTFDLTVYEERYNILIFKSGNAGLSYSR
mgnify:FL=1